MEQSIRRRRRFSTSAVLYLVAPLLRSVLVRQRDGRRPPEGPEDRDGGAVEPGAEEAFTCDVCSVMGEKVPQKQMYRDRIKVIQNIV